MNKPKLLLTFIGLLAIVAFHTDTIPTTFSTALSRGQLSFTLPTGLTETPSVKNSQMNYDYALKYPGKNFEVRYAVRPLDSLLRNYERLERTKKAGDVNVDPNKFYASAFMATMMNITGGRMNQMKQYNTAAASKEFNAGWGATCSGEVNGTFGKGYKYCLAVAIHRDNAADAYIFYLSDNPDDLRSLIIPVFHAMKFR